MLERTARVAGLILLAFVSGAASIIMIEVFSAAFDAIPGGRSFKPVAIGFVLMAAGVVSLVAAAGIMREAFGVVRSAED